MTEPAIDPVCGMKVDPVEGEGDLRARRHDLLLLLPGLRDEVPGRPRGLPLRHEAERHALDADGRAGRAARRMTEHRPPSRLLPLRRQPCSSGRPSLQPPASSLFVGVPDGPRGPERDARRVSEVRHGARAGALDGAGRDHRIHVPDAPRSRQRQARRVPQVRHGARASRRRPRRRAEPRARRHDAPLLDRRRARPAGLPVDDGRHGDGRRARAPNRHGVGELDRARARDAGGPLVRLAVLRSACGRRSSTRARTCSR